MTTTAATTTKNFPKLCGRFVHSKFFGNSRVDLKLEWVTTRVRPRQAQRRPGKAVRLDVRTGVRPHVRPGVRPDVRPEARPDARPDVRPSGRTRGRKSGRKSGRTPGLALAWRGRTLVLRTLVIGLPEYRFQILFFLCAF